MYAQFESRLSTGAVERPHAALELRQQVLLIAATVGLEDDLRGGLLLSRW